MEEDVKRKNDLLTQIRQQGGGPNANRGTLWGVLKKAQKDLERSEQRFHSAYNNLSQIRARIRQIDHEIMVTQDQINNLL